jgi:hypothetical protein
MSERPPMMMVRRGAFLAPLTPADGEELERLPVAKPLKVKVSQGRSNPQLRLYWSLLGKVTENLDQDITPDDLHEWLKLKLGYTKPIRLRSGEIAEVPASIALDRMEAPEFNAYFDAVKALVTEHIIPRVGSAALEREARAMLGETV